MRLKLFESFNNTKLVEDAKDICLELNDVGINTDCFYNHPFISDGKNNAGYVSIGIEKGNKLVYWLEIEEVVDRLIEYFKLNDFSKLNINIDGDNLINTHTWIENIGKRVSYNFYVIILNFSK